MRFERIQLDNYAMSDDPVIDYGYADAGASHTHKYLWEPVSQVLKTLPSKRVLIWDAAMVLSHVGSNLRGSRWKALIHLRKG